MSEPEKVTDVDVVIHVDMTKFNILAKLRADRALRNAVHAAIKAEHVMATLSKMDVESSSKSSKEINPPALAESLLAWLAPKSTAENLLGDLQELFESHANQYGVSRARRFYWIQMSRAIGPGICRALTKWGFVGAVVEYGRRKLGL